MRDGPAETPETIDDFKEWCLRAIVELENVIDDPNSDKAYAAAIVSRSKVHAYRLTAYDLADVLPARDEKNPVDALLRLRECLTWLDSGGPVEPIGDGPYTVAQTANLLGISERHVYDLVNEGKIRHQRHGRTIRITREFLDQYKHEAERGPLRSFRHL